MLTVKQYFKDNEHYNETFGDFGDAFVEGLGWLFTDEAERYSLKDEVSMPQFVSVVLGFIMSAKGKHPEITLKDYIKLLKYQDIADMSLTGNEVSTIEIKGVCCYAFKDMTVFFIDDVMFATLIYFEIFAELEKNNPDTQRGYKAVLKVFKETTGLTDFGFKHHELIKNKTRIIQNILDAWQILGKENATEAPQPEQPVETQKQPVEQDAPKDESVTVIYGKKGQEKTHTITAERRGEILDNYDLTQPLKKYEWLEILHAVTGISTGSLKDKIRMKK